MKYVLISYPLGTKGYRLIDILSGKVFVSRNVMFFEHIYHFSNKTGTNKFTNDLILQNQAQELCEADTLFTDNT